MRCNLASFCRRGESVAGQHVAKRWLRHPPRFSNGHFAQNHFAFVVLFFTSYPCSAWLGKRPEKMTVRHRVAVRIKLCALSISLAKNLCRGEFHVFATQVSASFLAQTAHRSTLQWIKSQSIQKR